METFYMEKKMIKNNKSLLRILYTSPDTPPPLNLVRRPDRNNEVLGF